MYLFSIVVNVEWRCRSRCNFIECWCCIIGYSTSYQLYKYKIENLLCAVYDVLMCERWHFSNGKCTKSLLIVWRLYDVLHILFIYNHYMQVKLSICGIMNAFKMKIRIILALKLQNNFPKTVTD